MTDPTLARKLVPGLALAFVGLALEPVASALYGLLGGFVVAVVFVGAGLTMVARAK